MIYTLTTNPAIDMNISSNGFFPNKVNRTFNAVYTPNGKGLNVSFVLKHFGIPSKILGFFGGFSGQFIVNEAIRRDFELLPIWIDDITRINIFFNDGEKEYKLVNEGAFTPPHKQIALLNKLENLNDLEFLSISGSLPKGIDNHYYEEILKICVEKNTKIILDISANNLKTLLNYKPYLIKPNDDEVREIFGIDIKDENDAVNALYKLNQLGAQNILLTLGEKGAYFFNGRQIYYASAQPIKLVSSACAGDSALAAFLSVWLKEPENITEALKLSAATGANVAESNGIGDLTKVKEYKKNITIKLIQ
ncbi:MAG TPA: 1-phosphofructokinase [Pasteurellaceae bacterium]|nr:1-phosphofructokinase [Pasteurellaceae bacterium]